MANADQKTLLIEKAFSDLKEICKEFQYNSGSSNSEVKALLNKLLDFWETKEENNKFGFR